VKIEGKHRVEKEYFITKDDFDFLVGVYENKGRKCPECGAEFDRPDNWCSKCGYTFKPLICIKKGDSVEVTHTKYKKKGREVKVVALVINGKIIHFGEEGLKTVEGF